MDSKDLRELQARHRALERYMLETAAALDQYNHGEIKNLPKAIKCALHDLLLRLEQAEEVAA